MKKKLATLIGTFFISLNASLGIRKHSDNGIGWDRYKQTKPKPKNKSKWGKKYYV